LAGKQLELLKELVPGASTLAAFWERGGPLNRQAAEAAARARGWRLLVLENREAGQIEAAFKAAADAQAGAIFVPASPTLFVQARRVVELAAKYRLPAIYEFRSFVEAGGLMSYGVDLSDIWHHAAAYVDKILRGARPADLPVEQPTKFELVINLKTAKALGLTIPQALLLRADEVIQSAP
jgi:putative ABC transport system substrate-binding protein